jgi:hypothetical protein
MIMKVHQATYLDILKELGIDTSNTGTFWFKSAYFNHEDTGWSTDTLVDPTDRALHMINCIGSIHTDENALATIPVSQLIPGYNQELKATLKTAEATLARCNNHGLHTFLDSEDTSEDPVDPSTKSSSTQTGYRVAVMLLRILVCISELLHEKSNGLIDLELSKLPNLRTLKAAHYIQNHEKDRQKAFNITFPKWDGLTSSWFEFSVAVKTTLVNKGLSCFLPEVEGEDNDKKLAERLGLSCYDVDVWIALSNAINHRDVKTPRIDFINETRWGGGYCKGHLLWKALVDTFDTSRAIADRLRYHTQVLQSSSIKASEDINLDSKVTNSAMIRASFIPLIENNTVESATEMFVEKAAAMFDDQGTRARLTNVSAPQEIRNARMLTGGLDDKSKNATYEFKAGGKDTKIRRESISDGWALGKLASDKASKGSDKTKRNKTVTFDKVEEEKPKPASEDNPKRILVNKKTWSAISVEARNQLNKGVKLPEVTAIEAYSNLLAKTKPKASGEGKDSKPGQKKGKDSKKSDEDAKPTKPKSRKRKKGGRGKARRIKAMQDEKDNSILNAMPGTN